MSLKCIKELNKGRINIRPITFWKALGLSFLFDLIVTFTNIPIDIFNEVALDMGLSMEGAIFHIISLIVSCIYQYGALIVIMVFINKSLKLSIDDNIKFEIEKKDYFFSAMLIVSYILITYGWFDYILFYIPSEMSNYVEEYFNSMPIIILLIESCIIAPIFEEVLYRGILLNGLLKKYNAKKAIIYSALVFGIAHLNLPQGINAFFLALIIGTVFYYTRSIYICMLMHFTNNLLVNFVIYPTSDLWTIILFIVVPIVGILTMIISFKILNFKNRKEESTLNRGY